MLYFESFNTPPTIIANVALNVQKLSQTIVIFPFNYSTPFIVIVLIFHQRVNVTPESLSITIALDFFKSWGLGLKVNGWRLSGGKYGLNFNGMSNGPRIIFVFIFTTGRTKTPHGLKPVLLNPCAQNAIDALNRLLKSSIEFARIHISVSWHPSFPSTKKNTWGFFSQIKNSLHQQKF